MNFRYIDWSSSFSFRYARNSTYLCVSKGLLLIELFDVEVSPLLQSQYLGLEKDPQLEDYAWLNNVGAPEPGPEVQRKGLKVVLEYLERPSAASAARVNVDHAIVVPTSELRGITLTLMR